ncbi:hypothetical protein C496_15337 [Natronorubrum tibetense GA33]|uniref:Uncharacterized protein n=1 Tax=Natronorubrum tibetense GA33 TaxID=1114856 RepID=L9VSJ5_9EURY|nr:hypothetical protein C496_15337 [Natronorubrum tibetense GA33]
MFGSKSVASSIAVSRDHPRLCFGATAFVDLILSAETTVDRSYDDCAIRSGRYLSAATIVGLTPSRCASSGCLESAVGGAMRTRTDSTVAVPSTASVVFRIAAIAPLRRIGTILP